MVSRLWPLLFCLWWQNASSMASLALARPAVVARGATASMLAKATKRKPTKKKGGTTKISTKGFGAKAAPAGGALLDEAKYADLYAWLSTSSLTNLKKVAVADFGGLRGVMALQDIGAGEEIVAIPATLAVDVGADGADVVNAAQRMLGVLAAETEPAYEPEEDELEDGVEVPPASPRAAYWATLPPPDSPDLCTPDFFSEKELMMLQWPPLVTETRKRSARIRNALGAMAPSGDVPTSHLSAAGGGMRLLRWAVWAVQSRVLTVVDRYEPAGRKLLIPFIDMFNHRAGTKHYLTGRTDGMLRVVAGAPVRAGEQIFIKYGTESTSNDEFVAHYGFHDPSATAATADRGLVRQHQAALPALAFSTIEEDEALLASQPPLPYTEQLAVKLRLSLKRAAAAEGLLPPARPTDEPAGGAAGT